jgi:hypothetical protein
LVGGREERVAEARGEPPDPSLMEGRGARHGLSLLGHFAHDEDTPASWLVDRVIAALWWFSTLTDGRPVDK